ncbi:MAG: 16S rRNA (uracil(1498)-N(3))-methyltransferase [Bacteroidia bacterium]|nr:16S rRNA (uracil(1498)-N(3))-methyltransferase [Bacteroidia bacterium]
MNLYHFQLISPEKAFLDEDESRHCIKVMRNLQGELIHGVDGAGTMYDARIESVTKGRVELALVQAYPGWGEHPFEVVLGISVLRQPDRFEWLAEKAVELGVTRLQPILSDRTVKSGLRIGRVQKIMLSAMKQCKRSRLPLIQEPVSLEDFIGEPFEGVSVIGWCEESFPVSEIFSKIKSAEKVRVLVGPEGGFGEAEVNLAMKAGFLSVSLGENRLRAETAGLHFLSTIKLLKGY